MNPLRIWLAVRLIYLGYRALSRQNYDRALSIARLLYRLKNPGGFEIRARALWGKGERKEAIRILEKGVQVAPRNFLLWDYLASFYSDEAWFDQALEAYSRALECPGAEIPSTLYNVALVQQRMNRHDLCVKTLSGIQTEHPHLKDCIVHTLAHSLCESGEAEQGLQVLTDRLKAAPEERQELGWLYSEKAWAEWRLGRLEDALQDAYRATTYIKTETRAPAVIREIRNQRSPDAKLWRLTVEGNLPNYRRQGETLHFACVYHVVADSPEEAIEFITPFEPEHHRPTLALRESQVEKEAPDKLKGVYWSSENYAYLKKDGKPP